MINTNLICPNTSLPEWKELVARVGIDGAYRQWISGQSAPTRSLDEVAEKLKKLLPSSIGLKAINELANNPGAWGAVKGNVIYLASNAPIGTEYHEAFHAVFRLMLSDDEIGTYRELGYRQILDEAKAGNTTVAKMIQAKRDEGYFSGQTNQQALPYFIEEWMASKFRDFMVKPKPNQTSWLSQVFTRLKNFLKGLLSKDQEISMLFRKIKQGKFVNSPIMLNEFNQEDGIVEPAYQLLGKATRKDSEGEDITPKFGVNETAQIIRDTASYFFEFKESELGKRSRWSDDAIIDKIMDLFKKKYEPYKDLKFLNTNEHDYWNLYSEKDTIEPDGTVTLGERSNLKKEVLKYLKNFTKLNENSRESDDEVIDDLGDKTYLNAEMNTEGGWGTLPMYVRQYIAKISYPIDKVILGYRDDITSEGLPTKTPIYQKKALNPTKVYNGLLRALANELSEEAMIEKLYNYGQLVEYVNELGQTVTDGGNLDTHYFVQKFLADTKININKLLKRSELSVEELREGFVPADDVYANLVYQKMLKGFNRWAKNTIFVDYDLETNEGRTYLANTKNVGQQQFEQWHNNYKNKTVNKDKLTEGIKGIVSKFIAASPYYKDQVAGKDFKESKKREELLAEDIGNVRSVLLSFGIDVSAGYIKYSLLYPKYVRFIESFKDKEPEFSRDTLTFDEFKFLTATSIFEAERLTAEHLGKILETFSKGSNPYEKTDSDSGIDDANIGRILNIAKGNAKLDETVFDSSYVAADGTVRYLHQDGTYHLKSIGKLRDPKFRQQLIEIGLRDLKITVGQKNGVPINIDDIDKEFVRNALLLSEDSDFLKIADTLKIEELDGIKAKITKYLEDENGGYDFDVIVGRETSPGTHFGKMSERDFAATLFILYAKPNIEVSAKGERIYTVPQLISVMETSKSSDYAYLPVIHGLYGEKGPTDKLIRLVQNELKKEYDRITRTYKDIRNDTNTAWLTNDEINDKLGFLVDDYHTGTEKARGLAISDKLRHIFTPQFLDTLQSNARSGEEWFSQNEGLINEELEKGIKDLVQSHLDMMINTSLISQETKDGKTTTRNHFLPKQYFDGDERIGFTKNFEQNVGQVTMQQWLNTMSLSHLLHGDSALMYKNDGANSYKREKPNNAKGASFKHNRTISKLGVTPFEYSRMVILDEPKGQSVIFPVQNLAKEGIDIADAQVWGSVQAIRNALFGLGRLTPDVAVVLDKMERGDTLTADDFFDANGEIINQDRFINSFKFVFKDSKRTVKMSVVALTKELTSVKIGNKWYPRPGREQLHNMREAMEHKTTGFDFVGPKSGFKTYRSNVLTTTDAAKSQYEFRQARPQLYDNEYFMLQLENPSNKVKITTPTQLLHAIDTEQDDSVLTYLVGNDGEQLTIGQVREQYQEALANKSMTMFLGARAEMYEFPDLKADLGTLIQQGKIVPRLARFQEKAMEGLIKNGGDTQLLEFFEVLDGVPAHNLNNDLVIEKYTQLYLAHFSKGAFSLKNPGHAVALFSNYSMDLVKQVVSVKADGHIEWRVVKSDSDEYTNLVKSDTNFKKPSWAARVDSKKDIRYIDPNLSVGDFFTDKPSYSVPEYKGDNIVGYYSEAVMPVQSYDQAKLIGKGPIPEVISYLFGNRIPLQDKHSMLAMKWVDTLPIQYGSTGVFPSEIVQLSGADFDIDKLYMSTFDQYTKDGQFYRYGEKQTKQEQFDEYLKWQLKNNKFLKSFITEFKNQDPRYDRLMDQLWVLKSRLKDLEAKYTTRQEYQELKTVLERALGIRYDEEGNISRIYDWGEPIDKGLQRQLLNKIDVLESEINAFDSSVEDLQYYSDLAHDINLALTAYEYEYLLEAIKKYAPTMPKDVDSFDNLYNTGAANNVILKSWLALLTNDGVRNGIADQPATEDYIKSGGNTQSNDMNPAFFYEDENGQKVPVFGNEKKYPIDSMVGHVNVKRKNNIGKDNIGVDVSGNVQNTILKKGEVNLTDYVIDLWSPELKKYVSFDTFSVLQEIDMATGLATGRRLMDSTSSKISSSTDEANNGNNARFNLGVEQSKVISVLNHGLGIPYQMVVALVNQPAFASFASSYKSGGLRTAEERKYQSKEEYEAKILKDLEDMITKEEEDKAFVDKYVEEHGSLDPLFTFENLAKFLNPKYKKNDLTMTVEERVTFNYVQAKSAELWGKAIKISDARAELGNILSLNKGMKDFQVLTKAILSSYKLGLATGTIDDTIPFDVRYILTGDSHYPKVNNYVHKTSIAYLNQATQVYQLAKLNFLSKTGVANEMRNRLTEMMGLYGDLSVQLEKDFLSFVSIAAYKNLVEQGSTMRNNLLLGKTDDTIVGIYKLLKNTVPNNPLGNYIISNRKVQSDGETFNTLEANSFTRLNDLQLGNLINGFIDLEQNPETTFFAEALFDYLIVKDGMQFKNKSISKVIPAEMFSNLSKATGLTHNLLLAETREAYLRVASELSNLSETHETLYQELRGVSDVVLTNTLYDTILGYNPQELFNRFYHLVATQPAYAKKIRFIQTSKAKYVDGNYIFQLSDDKSVNTLREAGFDVDTENLKVNYPKFIRSKNGFFILTAVDNLQDPNGVQLDFKLGIDLEGDEKNKKGFRGMIGVYRRISVNTNEKWNKMADLDDLRLDQGSVPTRQEISSPIESVEQTPVPEVSGPAETVQPVAEVPKKDYTGVSIKDIEDEDEQDYDTNYEYKSVFANKDNTTDNTNRCD